MKEGQLQYAVHWTNTSPNSANHVEHDLLGAARALLGDDPGIACILGTGSNTCAYDGKKIVDNVQNLAFILGDEGSASHIGKRIMRSYFYREMPEELAESFKETYPQPEREIINGVYAEGANVYLASFARFAGQHKEHPFIHYLVSDALEEFVERHVIKYYDYLKFPVCSVGSVAYFWRHILRKELNRKGLRIGKIIQKPIDSMIEYHLKHQ